MTKLRVCRACGTKQKLVRAHVIPESFCKLLAKDGKPAKLAAPHEYVGKSHTGVWDETILCESCERQLSSIDDYGQELLIRKRDHFDPVIADGKPIAERLAEYDYQMLHWFILSVLWRASVSSHYFFNEVDLGAHEDRIKAIVFGKQPTGNNYPFSACYLVHQERYNMMLAPIRRRVEGTNCWSIYIGDFNFWMKVDSSGRTPSLIKELQAVPDAPLFVVARNLIGSPEHRAAISTARLQKIHQK